MLSQIRPRHPSNQFARKFIFSMGSRLRALLSGIILLTFRRSLAVIDAFAEIAQGELSNKFSRRPRLREDDGLEVHKIIPDSSAPSREVVAAQRQRRSEGCLLY